MALFGTLQPFRGIIVLPQNQHVLDALSPFLVYFCGMVQDHSLIDGKQTYYSFLYVMKKILNSIL